MSQWPPPPPPPPPGDPPGPPPGAYHGAASGAPFDIGQSIAYGWRAYWQNLGPMLMITLVIFVINVLITAIDAQVHSALASFAVQLAGQVLTLLLALGVIRASLEITGGRKPEVGQLFIADGFGAYLVASILFAAGLVLGFVVFVVPAIVFASIFYFYGYVIAEYRTIGPIDAFRRSAQITKGQRWKLIGLGIMLILLNVAGVLACLVGVVFTYGITCVSLAHAYRTLSGEPIAPLS